MKNKYKLSLLEKLDSENINAKNGIKKLVLETKSRMKGHALCKKNASGRKEASKKCTIYKKKKPQKGPTKILAKMKQKNWVPRL